MAAVAIAAPLPKLKLEGMTNYGCSVRPTAAASFRAQAWAEHDGKRDWQLVLSERQGKRARRKGLMDCDDFMAAVEKEVEKWKASQPPQRPPAPESYTLR